MKIEGILALIGGIFGLIGATLMLFFALGVVPELTAKALGGFVFSALAIVSAITCNKRPRTSAVMMFVSVIGGFLTISLFYLISIVLLIIAGIMSFRKGGKKVVNNETTNEL